jgi:hypothetical protein
VIALSAAFDDPEHWLKLAQDSRVTADKMADPFSKRTLLLIAKRYDLAAARAKQRTEPNREPRREGSLTQA